MGKYVNIKINLNDSWKYSNVLSCGEARMYINDKGEMEGYSDRYLKELGKK